MKVLPNKLFLEGTSSCCTAEIIIFCERGKGTVENPDPCKYITCISNYVCAAFDRDLEWLTMYDMYDMFNGRGLLEFIQDLTWALVSEESFWSSCRLRLEISFFILIIMLE